MKKGLIFILILALSFISITSMSYAATKTLEEIVAEAQSLEEVADTNTSTSQPTNNGSSMIQGLSDAAKLDQENPEIKPVTDAMSRFASLIVQIIAYGITVGLTIVIMLDLAYIVLPFTRPLLSNGNAVQPMQQGGMGGMGGMGMGGLGMGGLGMGGMGGYGGMNRYGGGMMGGMGGMGMGQQQQPGMLGRMQFVSNAALSAVANETVPGPDGKPASPLKAYANSMIIVLVVTPILLVMALTGVLAEVGFVIGNAIAGIISGLGGHIS